MILRNRGAWFSCGTASERDLRLPRLHASMLRGEIRLQILWYHMMHHHDGFFFFVQGSRYFMYSLHYRGGFWSSKCVIELAAPWLLLMVNHRLMGLYFFCKSLKKLTTGLEEKKSQCGVFGNLNPGSYTIWAVGFKYQVGLRCDAFFLFFFLILTMMMLLTFPS